MLNRRLVINCAICAVGTAAGLLAASSNALAQAAPGGVTRKILGSLDMPGGKLVCVQVVAEIEAGALVARHTHPGIESAYILEGGGTLSVKGQPDRVVKAADSFLVSAETPHSLQAGSQKTRVMVTYTVEKDKPLAPPAPA